MDMIKAGKMHQRTLIRHATAQSLQSIYPFKTYPYLKKEQSYASL